MRKLFRWLALGTASLVLLVVCVAIVARFTEPIAIFPGGMLGGEPVGDRIDDWSFVAGVSHIQVEVNPREPRSVNTAYILLDGKLYVPALWAARKTSGPRARPGPRWHSGTTAPCCESGGSSTRCAPCASPTRRRSAR